MPGLVPDEVFFDHLAHRRFVAGRFIRRPDQIDYLQEPDVFHDVFGHVPLLSRPGVRRLHAGLWRGRPARRAAGRHRAAGAALLAHGGVRADRTAEGLRIYGSGIVSSHGESIYALDDPRRRASPSTCGASCAPATRSTTIQERLLRHRQLRGPAETDPGDRLRAALSRLADIRDLGPADLLDADVLLTRGTQDYAAARAEVA